MSNAKPMAGVVIGPDDPEPDCPMDSASVHHWASMQCERCGLKSSR
jgi:hypothetical protein